jgi:hypothetical protein
MNGGVAAEISVLGTADQASSPHCPRAVNRAYLPCALLYLPGRTTVQNPDIVRTDYCVTFLIADVMFAVRDENKQISTTPSFDKMRRTIKAISTRLFLEPVRNFVPG